MKHSICGFNHLELLLNKIDCVDVQIIRCIVDFRDTGKMKTIRVNNKEYFWISYEWLIDELPICEISSSKMVGRIMSKLVQNGLMERYIELGNRTYYRFIEEKIKALVSFPQYDRGTKMEAPAQKSAAVPAQKSAGPALESSAIYPNTNNLVTKEDQIKEVVPEYRECSDLLKNRVLETRQQKITNDTLIKWDNTVRLMVQRDERTIEDIKKIINECHDMPPRPNGFTWRDNILSMDSLRLRWNEGKIYIGINNNGNSKKQEGGITW
ncbi:MAG: hypothetical protein WC449_06120 [Candidatus Paceibacterota bacterium]